MTSPNSSIRIRDLVQLQTTAEALSKAPLLIPVASNNATPDTFAIELSILLNYFADTGLAKTDLSNLDAAGQLIINTKLGYLIAALNTDLNSLSITARYQISSDGLIDINAPAIFSGSAQVDYLDLGNNNAFQQFISFADPETTWVRRKINDVWSAWAKTTQSQSSPIFDNAPIITNPGTAPNTAVTNAQLQLVAQLILPYNNIFNYGWIFEGAPSEILGDVVVPEGMRFVSSAGDILTVPSNISQPLGNDKAVFLDSAFVITQYDEGTLTYDGMSNVWTSPTGPVVGVLLGFTNSMGEFTQDLSLSLVTTKSFESLIQPFAISKRNRITGVWTPWTSPTLVAGIIQIPEITYEFFNPNDYSGTHLQMTAPATTFEYDVSMGNEKTLFIVARVNGTEIEYIGQDTPPSPSLGATTCLIGSVYIYNSEFEDNTFVGHPWLVDSDIERRELPEPKTVGFKVEGKSDGTTSLANGKLLYEGIDAPAGSVISISEEILASWKWRYPDRSAAFSIPFTDLAANGGYVNDGGADLVDATATNLGKYVVLIFGKTVSQVNAIIPPNSTDIFDSQNEALQALVSLTYDRGTNYDIRTAWTFSAIYKVGSTDLTTTDNFLVVNSLPSQLNPATIAPALLTPQASEVEIVPIGSMDATNVQAALEELKATVFGVANDIGEKVTYDADLGLLNTGKRLLMYGYDPTRITNIGSADARILITPDGKAWNGIITAGALVGTPTSIGNVSVSLYTFLSNYAAYTDTKATPSITPTIGEWAAYEGQTVFVLKNYNNSSAYARAPGALSPALGTLQSDAAPNITGSAYKTFQRGIMNAFSGACTAAANVAGSANDGASGGSCPGGFNFDASRSNAAYGRDSTTEVRVKGYTNYYYIKF